LRFAVWAVENVGEGVENRTHNVIDTIAIQRSIEGELIIWIMRPVWSSLETTSDLANKAAGALQALCRRIMFQ